MEYVDYSWETVGPSDKGTYSEDYEVPDDYVERSSFLDSIEEEEEDVINSDKTE